MAAHTVTGGELVRLTAKLSRSYAHFTPFLYVCYVCLMHFVPNCGTVSSPPLNAELRNMAYSVMKGRSSRHSLVIYHVDK